MNGIKHLRYSQQAITPEDEAAVLEALRSDYLTCGPRVEAFEAALCAVTGARFAVAVNSGTAALHLSLLAAGIGEGDTVATSPLSFVASANAALYCGARPIFIDVERDTGNMSARTLAEAQADPSWPGADAILPVHYAGRPVDVQALAAQAGKGTVIIEDSAHALGAVYSDGSTVGASVHSLAACMSFHAIKSVVTGEGGAVLTGDEGFADEVRSLRNHGRDRDGLMRRVGINARLTDFQAALGTSQLRRLLPGVSHRFQLAVRYDEALACVDVERPPLTPESAWHLYPVLLPREKRNGVRARLRERGIGVQSHYDPPIHLHPAYRDLGWREGDFPVAEDYAARELSLPLHVGVDEGDVLRVVAELREALS